MRRIEPCVLAMLMALWMASAATAQSVEPTLQIYDVRDLVQSADVEGEVDEVRAKRIEEATEHLAEVIREYVQPEFEAGREETKAILTGSIAVIGRPEQHQWTRRFLEHQRKSQGVYFDISARFITVDDGTFEFVFPELEPQVFDDEEAGALVSRLLELQGADVLSAPRLLVLNRQKAMISVGKQIKYVRDYEVHENVLPGDRTLEVPIVDSIFEGIEFGGRVTRLDGSLGLEVSLDVSDLERPIPTLDTPYGPVALPELTKVRLESTLHMADGATAVFPGRRDDGRNLLIVIRVARVDLDEHR